MPSYLEDMEPLLTNLRKQFLDRIKQEFPNIDEASWSNLSQKIITLDKQLQSDNKDLAKDLPGALYLKIACTLLAGYRTLQPLYKNNDKILNFIREFITDTYIGKNIDAFFNDHFGITPEEPEKAWKHLRENYIAKSSERFGCNWIFEKGINDQRRFFVNVRKCGFADFFLDHEARDLLYVLCATDYTWGDQLKKYNIRFERPTTLSEGGDACRFQFFKDDCAF